MAKLLIIADDLTGALDTGIQFSQQGISTCVETNMDGRYHIDFHKADVVVVNAESRHILAESAYRVVKGIAEAGLQAGAGYIYKKTDSALRGNVGAELRAVCDAMGESVCFIPAFPAMKRVTRGGVHYCSGVEVSASSFGRDPVDPVRHSAVEELIGESWQAKVTLMRQDFEVKDFSSGADVFLFDCETDSQLTDIFETVQREGFRLTAGCAGFAAALASGLSFERRRFHQSFARKGMLVVCGSMNPASARQVAFAASHGFEEVSLTANQISEQTFAPVWDALQKNQYVLVHTLSAGFSGLRPEEIAQRVGDYTGTFLKDLLDSRTQRLLMIIGGDTLMGFIRKIGCPEILPCQSLTEGTVLSMLRYQGEWVPVASKSGGFGEAGLILTVKEQLQV